MSRLKKSGVTEIKILRDSYTWTISNVSHFYGLELRSSSFSLGTEKEPKWYLKGTFCKYASSRGIFVHLCRQSTNDGYILNGECTFSILDDNSEKFMEDSIFVSNGHYTNDHSWKSRNSLLFEHAENNSKRLLRDSHDSLTILCEVVFHLGLVSKSLQSYTRRQPLERPQLEKLLTDEQFSDVTLVTPCGQELRAHKCVLSASSLVFAAMFKSDMLESKRNVAQISDVKRDVLEQMLRYIYGAKLENIENMVGELLAAAHMYQIEGLKFECLDLLVEGIAVDNVVEISLLADRYGDDELKRFSATFIKEHFKDVVDSKDFRLLSQEKKAAFFNCIHKIV